MITTWSYSRWGVYKQCPFKAKLKFIDKLEEPGSPAMDRGTAIHKMAEDFVTVKPCPKLPTELAFYGAELRLARKSKPIVEQEWGFTRTWEPTGWSEKDTWLRAKCDLIFTPKGGPLTIVDHKTGKRYDDHAEQLSLYALLGFIKFPEVPAIKAEIWYLDQGKPTLEINYTREDERFLRHKWEENVRPMFNDTMFAPKPGYYCRWCFFRKGNGGPCEF